MLEKKASYKESICFINPQNPTYYLSFFKNKHNIFFIFFEKKSFDEDNVFIYDDNINSLQKWCTSNNIIRLFPCDEKTLELSEYITQQINPNLYFNKFNSYTLRSNKYIMQRNIPPCIKPIKSYKFNTIDDNMFPLISKPFVSRGSENITIINDKRSLLNINKNIFFLQEIIYGDVYLISGFIQDEKVTYSIVERRVWHIENNLIIVDYSEASINIPSKLSSVTKETLKALNFEYGFFSVEFILQNDDFFLLEINPRVAGENGRFEKWLSKMGAEEYFPSQIFINEPILNKKPYIVITYLYSHKFDLSELYSSLKELKCKYDLSMDKHKYKKLKSKSPIIDIYEGNITLVTNNKSLLEHDMSILSNFIYDLNYNNKQSILLY